MTLHHQERLRRVQEALQASSLGYMLLSISPDLFYLTGYSGELSERLHMLVVPPGGRPSRPRPPSPIGLGPAWSSRRSSWR
jgi:Xaa-Pro aminopeptidase